MKQFVFLSVTCATLLLAVVAASFLASSHAHAGNSSSPRIQMFSATFTDQNLPTDGSKATLLTIPFRISAKSTLVVTSLINAIGVLNSVNCELDIDNVSFFNVWTSLPNSNSDSIPVSVGLSSVTTGIAPGKHTFAVKCHFSNTMFQNVLVHSLGTSVVVSG